MNDVYRLSCSCHLGGGPSFEEALHVLVWSKKYICDPKLQLAPDN